MHFVPCFLPVLRAGLLIDMVALLYVASSVFADGSTGEVNGAYAPGTPAGKTFGTF
jgi:hypothetical protein